MNNARRTMLIVLAIGIGVAPDGLWAVREDAQGRDAAPATDQAVLIDELISQLGSEQYPLRHRAELQLIDLGTRAFDQLQIAMSDSDLEVATRAKYILHRIRVEWVHPDDPVEVKSSIQQYGDLSVEERKRRIQKLASLGEDHGFGALCRIVRFDLSPIVARHAALAVLAMPEVSSEFSTQRREIAHKELGASQHKPVDWVRGHLEEDVSSSYLNEWLGRIDVEVDLLEHDSEETNFDIVYGLLKYHLQQGLQADNEESTYASLSRMVNLHLREGGELQTALVFAFSWGMEHAQWHALDQLEKDFADELAQDRLLLYVVAAAADQRGDALRAQEISQRAFELAANDESQRGEIAGTIAELGRHDWAEREWQYAVEHLPPLEALYAGRSLATLRLHDRGEHKAAASLLSELLAAMKNDPNLNVPIKSNTGQKWLDKFEAEIEYYLACEAESKGDFRQQREHLEKAIKSDTENPDILIAMYRLKNADEAFRENTLAQIQKSSKLLEDSIKQNQDNPHYYNHWAWLIGNTEGDYEQAIAYSHRSLELRPADPRLVGDMAFYYYQMRAPELLPDSPSYLDTLGRCYYAAGDLENAIKYQRQAIEGHPHLMVMRRQLEFFESELAKR